MLAASHLSMRYGAKILFNDASFQLNPGQHYGLVGANGSGKSTLIKLLAGELTPEKGEVSVPAETVVGSLKQDHFIYEDVGIRDVVLMGKPVLWNALEAKKRLLEHEQFSADACDELERIEKAILHQQGYAAPSEASKLLEGLGLPATLHDSPLKTLSGGYKLRVLLAQLLFSGPDILILDEPTNHLDLFSIRWLEEYLRSFEGILLVSSHDRHFLNAVCGHIIDLDRQTVEVYRGNYNDFEELKLSGEKQKEAVLQKHLEKKEHIEAFVDRFKAKASKARQAQSKMRQIEKLQEEIGSIARSPSLRKKPHLKFTQNRPSGAKVLKLDDLSKSYGSKQVISKVSLEIERGDRVAFIGPNGIGKSTLLEIITHAIPACSGKIEWGHAVEYAYFPQDHQRCVDSKESILSWLRQADPLVPEEKLRAILGRVLFTGEDAQKPIHVLSGGETARLLLAKMMAVKHNVLIFDEPTNHLDMEAVDGLIDALEEYPGTILFVSHNRYFVSKIAERIIEITSNGIRDFNCTYDEYIAQNQMDHLCAKSSSHSPSSDLEKAAPGRRQYEQQKQHAREKAQLEKKAAAAEERCHAVENQLEEIDKQLASDGFYQNTPIKEQEAILAEKRKLEKELATAFDAWEHANNVLLSRVGLQTG